MQGAEHAVRRGCLRDQTEPHLLPDSLIMSDVISNVTRGNVHKKTEKRILESVVMVLTRIFNSCISDKSYILITLLTRDPMNLFHQLHYTCITNSTGAVALLSMSGRSVKIWMEGEGNEDDMLW